MSENIGVDSGKAEVPTIDQIFTLSNSSRQLRAWKTDNAVVYR